VKIHSPVEVKKARIEIIPLIDIMFFLLASFMAVSLSMIQMRGVGVNLPGATNSQSETNKEFVAITVLKDGAIYLENDLLNSDELFVRVQQLAREKSDLRIYIRADKDVSHGIVIGVLDQVRSAGAKRTAFEVKAQSVTAPARADVSAPPTIPPEQRAAPPP
jgi:biopolymer transport protein ExbD